jgi:hypothetical protein
VFYLLSNRLLLKVFVAGIIEVISLLMTFNSLMTLSVRTMPRAQVMGTVLFVIRYSVLPHRLSSKASREEVS